MKIELITRQDLEKLKQDLIEEIAKLMRSQKSDLSKEWLRSKEVRKLLNVSSSTLVNMRIKGLLTPSKISGVYYYKRSEIEALLENGTQE